MSFDQVLEKLPSLTLEQRQVVIRRAVELDDPPFSEQDEHLIESRLAAHRADPSSAIPLEEMKTQLRRAP